MIFQGLETTATRLSHPSEVPTLALIYLAAFTPDFVANQVGVPRIYLAII